MDYAMHPEPYMHLTVIDDTRFRIFKSFEECITPHFFKSMIQNEGKDLFSKILHDYIGDLYENMDFMGA